jgi:hypothetical protein
LGILELVEYAGFLTAGKGSVCRVYYVYVDGGPSVLIGAVCAVFSCSWVSMQGFLLPKIYALFIYGETLGCAGFPFIEM